MLSVMASAPFCYLVDLQMCFGSYEVGVIQRTPIPRIDSFHKDRLGSLGRVAWSFKRTLDTVNEVSHAFILPEYLLKKAQPDGFDAGEMLKRISAAQSDIDDIVYHLYGLGSEDRAAIESWNRGSKILLSPDELCSDCYVDTNDSDDTGSDDEGEEVHIEIDCTEALLSWTVGVSFGRFDIRLATGGRPLPPEPEPFDPLPNKSPGMLPDGDPPLHANPGILVDDKGHPHDLVHLMETVLERVNCEPQVDSRTWLRREFFQMHLKQYSKSRRKAPIYWPLTTASGYYTLWIYYPALTDQTLFTAANDFVEPKIDQVSRTALALKEKTGRSRDEDRALEALETHTDELRELRMELLRLAPIWKPHHDDGVQITAAPLWRLFRLAPWQKLLKETWEKLEKGDYDWAHIAMSYWPERVRAKCRTDKSLAIAHELEHLFEPPPEPAGKAPTKRGCKAKG